MIETGSRRSVLYETVEALRGKIESKSSFKQLVGSMALPILNSLEHLNIKVTETAESILDKLVKAGDSSPWRWLVDKILKHSLDRAYGHAVYFNSKEVSDAEIKHAYKKVFTKPKVFSNDRNETLVDPAYSMSVAKTPRIIHGFGDLVGKDLAEQNYKKSPIILKLSKEESEQISINKDQVENIKKLFKQAPFIIVLLEGAGEGAPSRSYIISSHFPQDGVVAGSLLQNFTKNLYGKENVVDVKGVSDADIEAQLKLSDMVETDGNTISESTLISGDEFKKLSEDFEDVQAQHPSMEIPKSVYLWLKILATLGVDGKSLTASNLRFNPRISEQLNLFNIENVKTILEKLENNETQWLIEHDLLHLKKGKDGKDLFGFARKDDITKEVVGSLLKSLPTSLYDKVWGISKIMGVLEALIPSMHISTIPITIVVGNNILEIGGICTTALSDHEQLGMVMMIHDDRLVLRWKRIRTKKDE